MLVSVIVSVPIQRLSFMWRSSRSVSLEESALFNGDLFEKSEIFQKVYSFYLVQKINQQHQDESTGTSGQHHNPKRNNVFLRNRVGDGCDEHFVSLEGVVGWFTHIRKLGDAPDGHCRKFDFRLAAQLLEVRNFNWLLSFN